MQRTTKSPFTPSILMLFIDKYEVTNVQYAKFLNEYGKITDSAKHKLIDLDSKYCLIEKSGNVYRPKSSVARRYGYGPAFSFDDQGFRCCVSSPVSLVNNEFMN